MNTLTMADVTAPKSDQWNADDFIAGPQTFTIREVQLRGGQEQPVNILLDGTDKAFRPCKSMSRVLMNAWGPDAKQYVGRSLTLYRDPKVKWGGLEVGGIRISHMSHIDSKLTLVLAESRAVRKPVHILPLLAEVAPITARPTAAQWADEQAGAASVCATLDSLADLIERGADDMDKLQKVKPDLWAKVNAAYAAARAALDAPTNEPAADMGDGFADEGDGA